MSFGIIDCAPPIEKEKDHAGDHQRIDYSYENLPVIGSEKKIAGLATFFSLFFLNFIAELQFSAGLSTGLP